MEPRKRLNGTGTPAYEALADAPYYRFEIPTIWVQPREVDFYNGPTRDIHGKRIGTWKGGYDKEGNFKGLAIDRDDPPIFELQASYLDRHGLLSDDEREYLPAGAYEAVMYAPD